AGCSNIGVTLRGKWDSTPYDAFTHRFSSDPYSRVCRTFRSLHRNHGGGARALGPAAVRVSDPVLFGVGPGTGAFPALFDAAPLAAAGQRRHRRGSFPDLDRAGPAFRVPGHIPVQQRDYRPGRKFDSARIAPAGLVRDSPDAQLSGTGADCGGVVLARLADAMAD